MIYLIYKMSIYQRLSKKKDILLKLKELEIKILKKEIDKLKMKIDEHFSNK